MASEGTYNTLGFALGGPIGLFAADQFQDLSSYEQSGLLMGAATGASIGFMFGGPIGAGIGAGVGAIGGLIMGNEQEDSAREAQEARDEARRQAMIREFGIMQQRSSMVASQARRAQNTGGSQRSNQGSATQALSESGFIGQNMMNTGSTTPSTSGTF